MSKSRHTEAQMIGALKQLEAGRKAEDVAREIGVSKHTPFSAPSLRMCRMKPQLLARPIPVFRHEPPTCVSLTSYRVTFTHGRGRPMPAPPTKPGPSFSPRATPPSSTSLRCLVPHLNSIQVP